MSDEYADAILQELRLIYTDGMVWTIIAAGFIGAIKAQSYITGIGLIGMLSAVYLGLEKHHEN